MKELRPEDPIAPTMSAALLVMARVLRYAPKLHDIDGELVQLWTEVMLEEGITAPLVHLAAMEVRKTRSEWPTPEEFLAVARRIESERRRADYHAAILANQAAAELPGRRITQEERQAILDGMSPGARELFVRLLAEGEAEGRREASRTDQAEGHGDEQKPEGQVSAPGSKPQEIPEKKA